MSDLGLDHLDCAHANVELAPYVCERHEEMHDAWECQDCGEEFVPALDAMEWEAAAQDAHQALHALQVMHFRQRLVLAVVGIFTFGLLVGRR